MTKSKSKTTVVVARATQVVRKRKARSRPKRSGVQSAGDGQYCTLEYFRSLVDPFEIGGLKMGWGCMVPTAAPQGYFRGQTTAFTDGSLAIMALPCASGAIQIMASGVAAGFTAAGLNLGNQPAITSNCGEGRVVSIGLRAFPNIALTSVPGAAYSGATVATTYATLNTLQLNDLVQLPTSHQSIGTMGVSSTGRPIDPESFTFLSPVVDSLGWAGTGNTTKSIPFSVPYVVFIGLPASAEVFYEVVVNFEATQVVARAGQTILPDTDSAAPKTVGDYWPTPESLHRALGPYLPHPGRPEEAAASKDASFLSAMWSGMKAGVGTLVGNGFARITGGVAGSAAQRLLGGPSTQISGQRYGRQFGGYLT